MQFRLALLGWAATCALTAASWAGGPGSGSYVDRDGNPGISGSRTGALPRAGSDGLREETVVVFTDRAAFLAAAGAVTTETFEDTPSSLLCDEPGTSELVFQHFTASAIPPALKVLRDACFGNHNTTQGGRKYLSADTDSADLTAEVTFSFPESLGAFGAFLIDLDDAALVVRINDIDYEVPANGDGGESFFGITSPTAFDTVSFLVLEGTDSHHSFDDVSFAPPGGVPPVGVAWEVEALPWGRVKASYRAGS